MTEAERGAAALDIDTVEATEQLNLFIAKEVLGRAVKFEDGEYWVRYDIFNDGRDNDLWLPMHDYTNLGLGTLELMHHFTAQTYTDADERTFPVYIIDISLAGDSASVTIRNQQCNVNVRHTGGGTLPLAICRAVYKIKQWEAANG